MSLAIYLRSHALGLACDVLAVVLVALLLPALGVAHDPTVLVCLAVALPLVAAGLHGYLRERRLMGELARIVDGSGEAPDGGRGADAGGADGDDAGDAPSDLLDAALMLEAPGYPEGDLAAEAVVGVARAGRAEAQAARGEAAAYRQYVETWVHEVKAPLAAMRLFLANRDDPALAPFGREVTRVDGLVEQALYYARSSSVAQDFLPRSCCLGDLVRDAVRPRARQLIEAHVAVGLEGLAGSDGAAPRVSCDPKWMAFVLGQLVDNAVRYRADPVRDGRPPHIDFSARVEAAGTARERVLLDVRDNGCGIDAADLPRVWDRGFTGTNGRARGHSTGMGLYLVRELCHKMGLSASIASEPQAPGRAGWTCVTVAFPPAEG